MNEYFIINQQKVGLWGCSSERLKGRAWKRMRLCEELHQSVVSADKVCSSGEEMFLPGLTPSSVSASPHQPRQ